MGKNKFLFILTITVLMEVFPLSLSARISELQPTPIMPVEWQAIRLQENIEEKIIRSLNPIIKESDYIIEVKIDLDLEKAEDPSSKKITKTEQKKKVRFTTSEAPKEGDDFVVFNKLGLEAPILGETSVETQTSEVELAQKAIIEVSDRYNLFNFLNGIEIKLTFDKGLTTITRQSIQKVISGLSFNTKNIIPQINTQFINIKESRVKADEVKPIIEVPATKWGERFKHLDIMIGIITGAVVLGLAAFFIARIGSKQEGTQESKNDNTDDGTVAEEDPVESDENLELIDELLEEGGDMGIDLTGTDAQTLRITSGLERFRQMMSLHFNEMTLMVKGWIRVGKGPEASALKSLVATLTDEELAEIFKTLVRDERSNWKMCLDSEMDKAELAKSFTYISNKIMEAMMVPSLIDDYEICDLLLAISAEDAARFCVDHPQLGVIFANVLSSKTIGDMFALMPIRVTSDIIEKSAIFRKEEVLAQMPLLKEKLLEIKSKRDRPPFLARIFDILPTAKPEIEKKLYATLIKHCSWEDVKETALNILPRELIGNLPGSVYKVAIGLMTFENQVKYFAVQDTNERDNNLDRFASKGAKNREMLEIEITALVKNETALKRLQGDVKTGIESDFLLIVRNYISSTVVAQLEMRGEVESWLREIKGESKQESKGLKQAA